MSNKYPDTSNNSLRVIIGFLLGAVLISFSGVWVKLSDVTPTAAAFYRVLFGGAFLLLGAIWRREFRQLSTRQAGLILLAGFIFAVDLVLFHISIQYVGPGLGTILPSFQVFVMAAVGALFFREKLRAIYVLSIPLALVGLLFIVGIHWGQLDAQYRTGIYAGLGTSLCYAGFLLSVRKLHGDSQKLSFFYVLMIVSFATTGFLTLEMLRTGDSFIIPDPHSLFSLLALGIFSQGVGWILISNALPRLRVSLSGLILLLQPALSFIWDVLFFRRPTSGLNWIGVAIVLAAIYMGTTGVKRKNR